MSRFVVFGVVSTFFVACLLPDFEVVPAETPGSDGGPGSDAESRDGDTPGNDAGADGSEDGGITCPTGFGNCDGNAGNACETDLKITAAHCGACGRSCGAATCENSECKTETIVSGLPQPFGLELAGLRLVWHEGLQISGCRIQDCASSKAVMVDVTGTVIVDGTFSPNPIVVLNDKFYFSQCPSANTDCSPAECDIAGCKLTGAKYLMPAGQGYRRSQVLATKPGFIVGYSGLDGLYRVPVAGGAIGYENMWNLGDGLQAIDYGPVDTVHIDPDASQANPVGGLFACPSTGCVGGRKRILPPPVRHLAVASGNAYTSSGAAATSSIVECAIAGCQSAGTALATNQAYVSDVAADEKAVYWTTIGAANAKTNTAAVGTVMMCALPGCPGGPQKIADAVVNPSRVRIDKTHVYWVERGSPSAPTGAIYRKRR